MFCYHTFFLDSCPDLDGPSVGRIIHRSAGHAKTAQLKCPAGHEVIGGEVEITCSSTAAAAGMWPDALGWCIPGISLLSIKSLEFSRMPTSGCTIWNLRNIWRRFKTIKW